ncbi:hypothetical protein jhhlp_005341 [Lomentospora prolificans]|uniref:Uncharacterized protein n=1 Tax=Lomentospora prolificans TaxID=41688 RepID=A0A2N3N7M8_9PEZI|nr:hypothetical protein jhhlp_005341 [Lomentospora prolificans]
MTTTLHTEIRRCFANGLAAQKNSSTYTASIASSVVNYPVEHGRRYHAYRSGSELDEAQLPAFMASIING